MFERFTDRARKVMALANQEAQRFKVIHPHRLWVSLKKQPVRPVPNRERFFSRFVPEEVVLRFSFCHSWLVGAQRNPPL